MLSTRKRYVLSQCTVLMNADWSHGCFIEEMTAYFFLVEIYSYRDVTITIRLEMRAAKLNAGWVGDNASIEIIMKDSDL